MEHPPLAWLVKGMDCIMHFEAGKMLRFFAALRMTNLKTNNSTYRSFDSASPTTPANKSVRRGPRSRDASLRMTGF